MKKQIIAIISFIASVISIFAFITGYQSLSQIITSGDESKESYKVRNDSIQTDNDSIQTDGVKVSGCTVYYIQDGHEYVVMKPSRCLTDAQISPDKKRVVGIAKDAVYISNYDGTGFHEYPLCNLGGCGEWWWSEEKYLYNLVFISNNTIRVFINLWIEGGQPDDITLGGFPINIGRGEYELTFDNYNSLISVKKR